MSGFQEILLVAVILLGILFVPRMLPRKGVQTSSRPAIVILRNLRVAIVASVIYPAVAAAFLQPWRKDMILFLYAGLGPVLLGWLLYWVLTGRKK
ncbi:hypothetical protein ACFL2E_06830 [Thermodesulfobacteriota bacterium]